MVRTSQLILNFDLNPVLTFETLVMGEGNRLAVEATHRLLSAGTGILTLVGGEGVGKSHLLAAAMDHHRRQGGEAACLQVSALLPHVGEMGEGMLVRLLQEHAHCGLVTVDGLELLADSPGLQEVVLYLFNQLRAEKRLLLMASRLFPGQLQNIREDLRTRLAWGAVVALDPPSDEMLGQILHKLAGDRQVNLAVGVIQYLVTRLPRRIPVYLHAIAQLDHAGLTQQRPITIALAKEVLEELHPERVAGETTR